MRGKHENMKIPRLRVRLAFSPVALLTFLTLGCGFGYNYPNPETSISATQNPLVAQYTLKLPRKDSSAWVEFGKDTTYGRQTSATPATAGFGQTVSILVAGMLPNTTYHMRAHVDAGGSWVDQDQTFTTGAITQEFTSGVGSVPLVLPTLTVTRPNPSLTPSSGVELLNLITPLNSHTVGALVTDLAGNIIWYYDVGAGSSPFPIKPLPNGHFVVLVLTGGLQGVTVLREIDLAGNTIREITPAQVNQSLQSRGYSIVIGGFHHDVLPLSSGHWIVLAGEGANFNNLPGYPGTLYVKGDALIDLDPAGNVTWAWSSLDHLDVKRHPFGLPDWTHSNAVVYTPNDGNLLLSMRNQSWILKIDYENGKGAGDILWRLGEGGDLALTGGDPSEWFYGQHFPNIVAVNGSQMTLAVFDDGNNRILDDRGDMCGMPGNAQCQSRGTVYQIEESTRTASLQWEDSPGLFTFWGGSIGQLTNGDVEFDLSQPFFQDPTSSQVMEVTQSADPEVVWQMVMQGGNAYRAYRIPSLYPGVNWQ
jgi:arylsulfate sulfotransferase